MFRYKLRTMLIAMAVVPMVAALIWHGWQKHIPAIEIFSVAIGSSLLSSFASTLLLFWRFDTRITFVVTGLSLAAVYVLVMLQESSWTEPSLLFQTRPAKGWEGIGILVDGYLAAVGGLAFGFIFAGLLRLAHYVGRVKETSPSNT